MKTAVEWLIEQLGIEGIVWLQEDFEQAKEMEKGQIIDAHFNGCEIGEMFNNENRAFITDSEQYYNKTFKQQEQ
jgi:hypothetical protein